MALTVWLPTFIGLNFVCRAAASADCRKSGCPLVAFADVTFYHHPLLLDDEGHKLSKSLGATSVQYFRKQHKKPADIYAFIMYNLGVTPKYEGLAAR